MNKSGCPWRALFGRRHWRCFEGSNTEKTVWGAARKQGVVGSGARTRFGGVLQTCVSAPRREKKVPYFVQKPPGYTRFCQFREKEIKRKQFNVFSWRFRRRWLLAIFFLTFSPGEVPSATPQPSALLQFDLRRVNERNQKVLSRAIHRMFQLAA